MRLKTKIAIFIAALFLTFAGFSLMVPSSALDLLQIGNKTGHEISTTENLH